MELRSHISWPAFQFRQHNKAKELVGVVTSSAIFDIIDGAEPVLSDEQRKIQLADEYIGEDSTRHLFRQADFVPFKPATDVTAIAQAWAPAKTHPGQGWPVGISIKTAKHSIEKKLRVYGPRQWEKKSKNKWALTTADEAKSVPLDYYRAFGGLILNDLPIEGVNQDANRFNPIGFGVLNDAQKTDLDRFDAPQIEDINTPIKTPSGDYLPQGFAPIAPYWRFRQQYTGTYDQSWIDTQHPFLPPDFDFKFFNCAHPDLIITPYLQGDEEFKLTNLHPHFPQMQFALPNVQLGAVATYKTGESLRSQLVLDGVHFELLQSTPKMRLTWRTVFPYANLVKTIDLGKIKLTQKPPTRNLAEKV